MKDIKPVFKMLSLALLLLGAGQGRAQRNNLFNTYVYDPFQLNMAYAGVQCSEANMHYRNQWTGVKDAPVLLQLNAHTPLGKTTGVGLRVSSQQAGLLNSFQATAGYAYHVKLSRTNTIHFGLGVGLIQNTLNSKRAVVIDADDATLGSGGKQKANNFDSELGAMFVGDKLKAGASIMHLYTTRAGVAGGVFKTLPQFNINLSYVFNKNENVEVEPWLVNMYTISGNNITEGLLNFNFMQTITAGLGYRSNHGVLFFLGIKTGNLKAGYSFDIGTSSNKTLTGSSHQLLLGFSNCNAKLKKHKSKRGRKIRSRF